MIWKYLFAVKCKVKHTNKQQKLLRVSDDPLDVSLLFFLQWMDFNLSEYSH